MQYLLTEDVLDFPQGEGEVSEASTTNAHARLFADVVEECYEKKKTGLLNVSVRQSSQFLVRVYFKDGNIFRVSYGPLHGNECLELLDCYDFGQAVFFEGMKAPNDLPPTEHIISMLRGAGKTVQVKNPIGR